MLVLEHAVRVAVLLIGTLLNSCICAAESRVGDELAHPDLDLYLFYICLCIAVFLLLGGHSNPPQTQ